MSSIDWRDDRGQVGGIEVLPFGILIFVVGALLVTNAWGVVDAKFATDSAAREAARAFVEATGVTDPEAYGAAVDAAVEAAENAIDAHGRDPDRATVRIESLSNGFRRCSRVVFEVTYEVPAIELPFIGGYANGFGISSTHSEVVDPFRSGVPGTATC